jgi:hypothetical protein
MTDVLALLAEANPVRVDDLAPLELPDLTPRPMTRGRLVASAVLATAIAASVGGVLVFGGTSPHRSTSGTSGPPGQTGSKGPIGPPGPAPATVTDPLTAGKRVTLAEASAAIGQPVVLPDTPLIRPRDAGPVWAWSHDTRAIAAVTYPAQRLFIDYSRPFAFVDPLRVYTGWSKRNRSFQVTRIRGIPAQWVRGNDGTGNNDVDFQLDDLDISVTGPYGKATLRSVAQSIVDRSNRPNDPGNNLLPSAPLPKTPVAIGEASKALGATIVLPARSRVPRLHLHAWLAGKCPPHGRPRCLIWVKLPKLTLFYEHPTPWPRSAYRQLVKMSPRFRLVELAGSPALMRPWQKEGKIPASLDFIVGGIRIVVWGRYGAADLHAIAASIINNSRTN